MGFPDAEVKTYLENGVDFYVGFFDDPKTLRTAIKMARQKKQPQNPRKFPPSCSPHRKHGCFMQGGDPDP